MILKKVILILSFITFVLIAIPTFDFVKGQLLEDIEEQQLKTRAINFFCEKHSAKKEDVKVINNYLYGKNENCSLGCYGSYIKLKYDDIEYRVEYDVDHDVFTDNTLEAELEYSLSKAIKDRYNFVSIEIDSQYVGYYSDEISYKNIEDIEKHIKNKDGFSGDLSVELYIDTATETMAKEYYEKYTIDIIQYMESFGVHYSIFIGQLDNNFAGVYVMNPKYYQLYISDNSVRLFDNINNKQMEGPISDYINGQLK